MSQIEEVKLLLKNHSDPARALSSARFFKNKEHFIGVKVPDIRKIAKQFLHLKIEEVEEILASEIHEERLFGLLVWTYQFQKQPGQREAIFHAYLRNLGVVNNWDFVDSSAPYIVGAYLKDKPKDLLFEWALSDNLWVRRIAVLSTFPDIKEKKFEVPIKLFKQLLQDPEDLVQKAVGWMLREIGEQNVAVLESYLASHAHEMARVTLRYAIEHFSKEERAHYLSSTFKKH